MRTYIWNVVNFAVSDIWIRTLNAGCNLKNGPERLRSESLSEDSEERSLYSLLVLKCFMNLCVS